MNNSKSHRRGGFRRLIPIIAIVLLLLIAAAALALTATNAILRNHLVQDRPIVLIQHPLNHEHLTAGEAAMTHATARAALGVSRIELWIDGEMVASEAADSASPLLTLASGWTPESPGDHVLLARAISAQGVEGQSSITVEVLEAPQADGEPQSGHIVEEGETMEGIADEHGADPEEIAQTNPDAAVGGVHPGDIVIVPEPEAGADEPAPPPDEAPTAEAPPPETDVPAPGSDAQFTQMMLLPLLERFDPTANQPVRLRIEMLALETAAAYQSLHCYTGTAGALPRWMPDVDGDPTTDESFASADGTHWDVDEVLSGESAPVITWRAGDDLPISMTCVAVAEGGTDAIDVGSLDLLLDREQWDGLRHHAPSTSGEGSFELTYRITEMLDPEAFAAKEIELDPNMTSPTNLRLEAEPNRLVWDYEPDEGEEYDGFRVFLNGTFQWVEGASARRSNLPAEWLHPPCGETYTFTVTAYRGTYTNGYESEPSNPVEAYTGDPGDEGCGRQIFVTFESLQTGDLGGDGRYDVGDMGPIYGEFYVNDEVLSFNGRCSDRHCAEVGFDNHTEYSASWLTGSLGDGGQAQILVEIPYDEPFVEIGFVVNDEDTGYGHDNHLVCSGEVMFAIDHLIDSTIDTRRPLSAMPDRCVVSYTAMPVTDSPVVEPGQPPPLPDLEVTNIWLNRETGLLNIDVRNDGAAAWTTHDLDVVLEDRRGVEIGETTWPDIALGAGERTILEYPVQLEGDPVDVCVVIDPENAVNEYAEAELGYREVFCRARPDLIVTDAQYDSERGVLIVTLENAGEGSIEHRDVMTEITLTDGSQLTDRPTVHTDISITPWHSAVVEISGIDAVARSRLSNGYTITVDPANVLVEDDDENNTFTVRAAERLWVEWDWAQAGYRGRNHAEYFVNVAVMSAGISRPVAAWELTQNIDWGSCFTDYCWLDLGSVAVSSYWFDIAGDEQLVINVRIDDPRSGGEDTLRATGIYRPDDDWGAGRLGLTGTCDDFSYDRTDGIDKWTMDYTVDGGIWAVGFHICMESLGQE